MSVIDGLILLVGSSLLLWVVLLGLAVGRKLRRDRRESRSVGRRARYAGVLVRGDVAAIANVFDAAEDSEARADLAVTIDLLYRTLPRERFEAIGRGMEASSSPPKLIADLGSRRAITRARAAFLLSRPGTAAAAEEIAPLLRDPDADVRLVACAGLARVATPRAAELLIDGLAQKVLPAERIIERLGAPWAVRTIVARLDGGVGEEGGAELEASLARALGLSGDPRGAAPLTALLDSDSVEVEISAARSLGRVGDDACAPALIAALSSDVWAVRAQAAKSLGKLGAAAAVEPLERCLSDRAWWVRANAARALRELGKPGIEALHRAVEHEDRYAADRAREQLALQAVIEEVAA
ncbi:MAG: HEAT repeat domain-containing protein [Actinobacteria bacterium]|nr:HEAT repeat domain-containing protein [Actinomycetota bacterium]